MARVGTELTALLVWATVGCQATEQHEPPPIEPGARTVLMLGLVPEGEAHALPDSPTLDGLRAQLAAVVDLSSGTGAWPDFIGGDQDLHAMSWTCPPGALGLEASSLTLRDTSEAQKLARPWRHRLSSITEGNQGAWTEPSEAAASTARAFLDYVRVSDANRCDRDGPQLSLGEPLTLDIVGLPAFAVSVGDGSAVVAELGGAAARIRADGSSNRHFFAGVLGATLGLYNRGGGEFYALNLRGQLHVGPIDGPFVRLTGNATISREYPLLSVAGSPAGQPTDVFVATEDRKLLHHDGRRWSVLARATVRPVYVDGIALTLFPSVFWLGPGRAVALGVSERDDVVVMIEDGVLRDVALPTHAPAFALALHPSLGILVSTLEGEIYKGDGTSWERLADSNFGTIDTLLPDGGGFFFSGTPESNRYSVGWYAPETGFCDSLPLAGPALAGTLIDSETALVIEISPPNYDTLVPRLVKKQRAPVFCSAN